MRAYLVNDTSRDHGGSAAAVKGIERMIIESGHVIAGRCMKNDNPAMAHSQYDIMVVNGEGTMRDYSRRWEGTRIDDLFEAMRQAKKAGKRVFLINAVWCNMPTDAFKQTLLDLDMVSVREIRSFGELFLHGVESLVCPDTSYYLQVPDPNKPRTGIAVGCFYAQNYPRAFNRTTPGLSKYEYVPIDNWDKAVSALQGKEIYITGQHHGVFAASLARCPFVHCRVNTYKITGLFEMAGVAFPIVNSVEEIEPAIEWAQNHHSEFQRFWDWLDSSRYRYELIKQIIRG